MNPLCSRSSIRQLVDSLDAGTRVVWIANGTLGTVQPDKTILWDDGHHMTHKQMNDSHALLIYTEADRRRLQETLSTRLSCVQRGCTLVRWDAENCKDRVPEQFCPLAILTEPESLPIGPRKHPLRTAHTNAA